MSVDGKAVTQAVAGLPLAGNEEGLIPAFGLYLTRHYAPYYNSVSYSYLHHARDEGEESLAKARAALIEAGHVCAFNTFGGIMLSQEWEAVVGPMIDEHADWMHGIVAIVNALGWGSWRIDELSPDEMRISIANSYESTGYLGDHGHSEVGGVCFLACGGVAGLMNLLYHGDITTRPALTPDYYAELFGKNEGFSARETACRAAGADRCEFIATR